MSLHVVLQNQTAQRTGGLVCRDTETRYTRCRRVCVCEMRSMVHDGIIQTFRFQAGEDEDEIVVEVGILIQLLQFLMKVL